MLIAFNSTTTKSYQEPYLQSHFEIMHPKLNSDNYKGHMDSDYTLGRPLVGIIILASLFLCTLIGSLLVILIFCKKKNTVFVLPRSTLSDAWRSSIEMNSLHSASVSEITGDWFMFCNGKKYPGCPYQIRPEDNQHFMENNAPMTVESAFLFHLLGSNIDSTVNNSNHTTKFNTIPRSKSCHSNFSLKLPSISALKRVVSKRGLKLSSSKTYERLGDREESNLNERKGSIYSNKHANVSITEMHGCAVSKRPWLANRNSNLNPLPSDYIDIKIHISRENYGVRNVYLSKEPEDV